MNEHGAGRLRGARQATHADCIDGQCLRRTRLGAVDVIERGAVDDDGWRGGRNDSRDSRRIGNVECVSPVGYDLTIRKRLDEPGAQLSVRARNQDGAGIRVSLQSADRTPWHRQERGTPAPL